MLLKFGRRKNELGMDSESLSNSIKTEHFTLLRPRTAALRCPKHYRGGGVLRMLPKCGRRINELGTDSESLSNSIKTEHFTLLRPRTGALRCPQHYCGDRVLSLLAECLR